MAAQAKAMIKFVLNLPSMASNQTLKSLPLGGFQVILFPQHIDFANL